jgi:alpha-beta hydrolase superfamily lysophospholipase
VVTISGSGPQDRDEAIPGLRGFRPFRQVADTLSRHGIAVLRLDDRGTGSSTGNHATATSADFAVDVRAAVAWLRARPEIDPARVALVGHSEGGLIAPMVAAEDPSLRAIVLMAGPAQTGRQILRFQLGNAVRRDTSLSGVRRDSALAAVDATIDSLGRAQPWIRFFLDYDPLATARRVRVPTLILQGATDLQVTAEQAESLERVMRAAGNRQVTRHTVPEANHLFLQDANGSPAGYGALPTRHVRPDVLALLLQWLQRALSSRSPRENDRFS